MPVWLLSTDCAWRCCSCRYCRLCSCHVPPCCQVIGKKMQAVKEYGIGAVVATQRHKTLFQVDGQGVSLFPYCQQDARTVLFLRQRAQAGEQYMKQALSPKPFLDGQAGHEQVVGTGMGIDKGFVLRIHAAHLVAVI